MPGRPTGIVLVAVGPAFRPVAACTREHTTVPRISGTTIDRIFAVNDAIDTLDVAGPFVVTRSITSTPHVLITTDEVYLPLVQVTTQEHRLILR